MKKKKYIINKIDLLQSNLPFPSVAQVIGSIRETNPNSLVEVGRDLVTDDIFTICENKPRSMLIYGIKWKEDYELF